MCLFLLAGLSLRLGDRCRHPAWVLFSYEQVYAFFSLLEFFQFVPLFAWFLFSNLVPRTTSKEWHPSNSGFFLQSLERGWPKAYQHESNIRDYRGQLTGSDRVKLQQEFRNYANLKIISKIGFSSTACPAFHALSQSLFIDCTLISTKNELASSTRLTNFIFPADDSMDFENFGR